MNYLIKPAVTLMNRLPLVYKFSLISILFLVVFTIVITRSPDLLDRDLGQFVA